MKQRSKEGATLAFTVTAIFFIVILGVGLFFLVQMLGGGREAQHATDAGNLNVSKQALKRPNVVINSGSSYSDSTTGQSVNQQNEYSGLTDSVDGNTVVDLVSYNRLVGKAFLMAANASAEGTQAAYNNAQAVIDSIEGPNGVGQQLSTNLASQNLSTNPLFDWFGQVAGRNSLRMANWNNQNQINSDNSNYQVAYMRSGSPTNVYLQNAAQVIPPGAQITAGYTVNSTESSNTNNYLVGYSPITVTAYNNQTLTIYGVPLRPGLEPHLVSQFQFKQAQQPPLAQGGTALVPPNAFQSQSNASEMHGGNLNTRSSAIVGSLNIQAAASIPNGYIAINNCGAGLTASVNTGNNPGATFLASLMGNGVYIMAANGHGYYSTSPGDFSANMSGSGLTPPPSSQDLATLQQQCAQGGQAQQCNNQPSGPTSYFSSPCDNLVAQVESNLPASGNSGGNQSFGAGQLMAIEYLKAQIINYRNGFDTVGCGTISSNPPCTGLKGYTLPSWEASGNANTINFGNVNPTLSQLLSQADPNGTVKNAIQQRLYEINPAASATDISTAWNSTVQFQPNIGGACGWQYLYWNGTQFTITTAAPPGFNSGSPPVADGPPLPAFPYTAASTANGYITDLMGPVAVNDAVVDVDGDGGFPHPFDCEPNTESPGSADDSDQAGWQPSTGRSNLLGVVKFANCAFGRGSWCCPC